MFRMSGFTLTEVLITLAIIGIVSAMTIPALVNDYQEKVTVTKVKKMYSVLNNAYGMYLANNSIPKFKGQNSDGAETAYKIFAPYLKVVKDCGTLNKGCAYDGVYLNKDESICGNERSGFCNYEQIDTYYKACLNDGSCLHFRGDDTLTYYEILYDVNGKNKPNIVGKDLFQFIILASAPDRISMNRNFDTQCALPNSSGWGCTIWVVNKGNLDYLKCNNLTWADIQCK